jgi:mannose-1-phosphate guanylyltransferase
MDVTPDPVVDREEPSPDRLWVVVLAGGEGARVRSLTRDSRGARVPKQFYAPRGGKSMLRWTLERARSLVAEERVVTVVAEQHRQWWTAQLDDCPPGNVVIQPQNRGTAVGLLLPLLEIMRRDPRARLLVLPSDHFVRDEARLRDALLRAANAVESGDHPVVLLGMVPEAPDTGYGWILPEGPSSADGVRRVALFREKPGTDAVRALIGRGAVVNSFIIVTTGRQLLHMYEQAIPGCVERLKGWPGAGGGSRSGLQALYRELPTHDFSRGVLQRSSADLSVLSVPGCGWVDLGTPARLRQFRAEHQSAVPHRATPAATAVQCA